MKRYPCALMETPAGREIAWGKGSAPESDASLSERMKQGAASLGQRVAAIEHGSFRRKSLYRDCFRRTSYSGRPALHAFADTFL
ncbi:hypothetical protein AGR2A_Cc160245 [Agrobacterium genomosp. 2 str. CFBP 5494]|uniref:Uncharacterized protein n=1 Tax=Agrobacterium genomosp. 2 str. CFBP 5494 TaxID=1183436 RepID=A0A9W5B0P2_9HYPH|nr:hypothetical protein AGR2A_Cc160245 [Agrobacterium genomosp. 2 str. CFBP 5494]